MHGESINKYLQPVADKIWALKETLRVSIQTETKPSDLSYEAMKIELPDEVDVDYPKAPEGWRDPVQPWSESSGFQQELREEKDVKEEKIKKDRTNVKNSDSRQLEIPFDYED